MAQSVRRGKPVEHKVGPGQYEIRQKMGATGEKFSFGASAEVRFKEIDEDDIDPGPGQYNPPSYTCTAPKYLFKQESWKEDKNSLNFHL